MPNLKKNANEQNNDGLGEKVTEFLPNVVLTTNPVVICGVNRRVGLAHYEHIDIYAGVAIPVEEGLDGAALNEAIANAAKYGFEIVSSETYERYKLLTEAQKPAEIAQ